MGYASPSFYDAVSQRMDKLENKLDLILEAISLRKVAPNAPATDGTQRDGNHKPSGISGGKGLVNNRNEAAEAKPKGDARVGKGKGR